jgi:hypothetical protein
VNTTCCKCSRNVRNSFNSDSFSSDAVGTRVVRRTVGGDGCSTATVLDIQLRARVTSCTRTMSLKAALVLAVDYWHR